LEIACKLKKIFPRISTRGFYDLDSGVTLQHESYHLYPKRMFDALVGTKEITIMIQIPLVHNTFHTHFMLCI